MKRIITACLGIVFLFAHQALATPDTNVPLAGGFFDNQYSAGTGGSTAYFVIDFGGTPSIGGDTFGFEYKWDGSTQSAFAALTALDNAGDLQVDTTNFGSFGDFIDTLSYSGETDTPDFGVDSRFWQYWVGTYSSNNVSWSSSFFGISDTTDQPLTSGVFYGFYAAAEDTSPRLPVAAPEPATCALAAIGGLLLICGGIRRRRLLLRDAVESAQAPH